MASKELSIYGLGYCARQSVGYVFLHGGLIAGGNIAPAARKLSTVGVVRFAPHVTIWLVRSAESIPIFGIIQRPLVVRLWDLVIPLRAGRVEGL